jgi:MerR family transcriptional regulator/heat shock protein HspR
MLRPDQPLYAIGVVAQIVNVHPQTLRRYDELGLVKPVRRSGRRLYSHHDIDRLQQIVRLTDVLGVNLAAVEVILRLTQQVSELQAENESIRKELEVAFARLERARAGGAERGTYEQTSEEGRRTR